MVTTPTVRVWVAPLLVRPAVQASLVASLSPAERARTERYRYARDARRFSVARGWLRHVLGAELGTPPASVRVLEGQGKPALAGTGMPRFNLSRAGELVVVAVAEREVGVDIEHLAGGRRGLDAASVACSPTELTILDQLPPGERIEAFLQLWTAKEAYLKATGVGLALSPDRVEVGGMRATGATGATPVRLIGEPGAEGWFVRELRPAVGYLGAVAAEGTDWLIDYRLATPLLRPELLVPVEVEQVDDDGADLSVVHVEDGRVVDVQ